MFSYPLAQKICEKNSINKQFENSQCPHSHVLLITINRTEIRYSAWSISILLKDTNLKNYMSSSHLTPFLIQIMVIRALLQCVKIPQSLLCLYHLNYLVREIPSKNMCWFCICHKRCHRRPSVPKSLVSQGMGNGASVPPQGGSHRHISPGRESQLNHLATK